MGKSVRSRLLFAVLTVTALIFSGCSSKQYFEPEQVFSADGAASAYGGTIVDQSRDGATLQSGRYIGKAGISKINLGKNYRFLSESSAYVLAGSPDGKLKVINRKSGKIVRTVSLNVPVVAAGIENGIVAYVLNDNTFGLYNVSTDKKLIENKSENIFAIDTRAATPMFIDNLAVVPMLDGKIVVVSKNDPENATVVYLSSHESFNNVIYLNRTGNTMVAATAKKLITIGDAGQQELRANISDVAISNGQVYIFTKEGEVIKLDSTLSPVARKKFKYVHFSAATAVGGRVYGLDQGGSLIVLNSNLTKHKIYDIGETDTPVFITGSKMYKDGKIIHLTKLGYE
jgi:WD40 repeat protein